MERTYLEDVARGALYVIVTAAALLALAPTMAAAPAAAHSDGARVSSVVGARMDNFNPGARLDPSQVIVRGE